MKDLFDAASVQEVRGRIAQLTRDSTPQWGKMNVAQMLAHCSIGLEMATGKQRPPRLLAGRILGPIIKPLALRNDDPMRKNSPTAPILIIEDEREFQAEQTKLSSVVQQFGTAGPACCTDHPHPFFGRLKPDEWAILMYKHVDHHLRQFGA